MINGHGDDILSSIKLKANFSSNVWHGYDLSGLKACLFSHFERIKNYPEPDAQSLIKAIAAKNNINAESIIVGNGSTELFYLIAQTFRKSLSTIIVPSFSEYLDAAKINGHRIKFIDRNFFDGKTQTKTDLYWLGNPNNPDGNVCEIEIIEEFIKNNSKSIIIIDEAYKDFVEDFVSAKKLIRKYDNLIVVQSLTKNFSIPGLRLGYLLASEKLISELNKNKMPWSVNTLAIEAGKYLLSNSYKFILPLNEIFNAKNKLISALNETQKLNIIPSKTHYFLAEVKKSNAMELKKYLLDVYSILIRDASNFYNLTDKHIRISTQSDEENNLLVEAIRNW